LGCPAPLGKPAVDQQNVEPGAGQIAAEDKPVVPGADDDAVVGFFERLSQIQPPCLIAPAGSGDARLPGAMRAGQWPSSRAECSETAALADLPCGELGLAPYSGGP